MGLVAAVILAGDLLGQRSDADVAPLAAGTTLAAVPAPAVPAPAVPAPAGTVPAVPAAGTAGTARAGSVPAARPEPPAPRSAAPAALPALPDAGAACSAPAAATIRDIVPGDKDFEGRWPFVKGEKTTVYFSYGTLPARYQQFVKTGARLWSRSPCIDARAVAACPARGNCSTVTVQPRAEDDSDGNSDSVDRGGVRSGNTLTLYTDYLDKAKESGALATTVHEMGHALGLMHREKKDSVMNADTIDLDNAVPDPVDYGNLRALYGGGRAPGTANNSD